MTTKILLKIVNRADTGDQPPVPLYVRSADFEGDEGRGTIVLTTVPGDAMQFENAIDAMEFWRTESKTVPVRPDGRPNRPLTAYTVELTTYRKYDNL